MYNWGFSTWDDVSLFEKGGGGEDERIRLPNTGTRGEYIARIV